MDPLIHDLVLHLLIYVVPLQGIPAADLLQTAAAPAVLLGPCCWCLLTKSPNTIAAAAGHSCQMQTSCRLLPPLLCCLAPAAGAYP